MKVEMLYLILVFREEMNFCVELLRLLSIHPVMLSLFNDKYCLLLLVLDVPILHQLPTSIEKILTCFEPFFGYWRTKNCCITMSAQLNQINGSNMEV